MIVFPHGLIVVHFAMADSPRHADKGAPDDNCVVDDHPFDKRVKHWTNESVDEDQTCAVQLAIAPKAGRQLLACKANSKVPAQETHLKDKCDESGECLESVSVFLRQKLCGPHCGSNWKDKLSPTRKQIRDECNAVKSEMLNEITPKLPRDHRRGI